jgi:tagatose 6-phosphate kinase
VLKGLKVKTFSTGVIGGAGGRFIKRQLAREKIRYDFCEIHSEIRTNLTILDPVGGKSTRILERGPDITKKDIKRFENKFHALLDGAEYAVFCGSLMPGMPDSIYAELIKAAGKRNVKTVLDTSGAALRQAVAAGPDVFKPNLQEAEFLWGRKIDSFIKLKEAALDFLNQGAKGVIITMGSRGALATDGRETFMASPPKIKTSNTVGCGDALLGGFLFSQYHKRDFQESLQIAVATAAVNCLTPEPGMIDSESLQELVDKVTTKRIQ